VSGLLLVKVFEKKSLVAQRNAIRDERRFLARGYQSPG
jgi:hypothetical protein